MESSIDQLKALISSMTATTLTTNSITVSQNATESTHVGSLLLPSTEATSLPPVHLANHQVQDIVGILHQGNTGHGS